MIAQSIELEDGVVSGVQMLDTATNQVVKVTADYYIFAVPADIMSTLLTPQLIQLAPSLSGIPELQSSWMNGIQFFLKNDVEVDRGFVLYIDTPWALTSVSQAQFWDVDWAQFGDGTANGVLSTIISNYTAVGILYNKTALECTPSELVLEVWAQLKLSCNKNGQEILQDDNVIAFSLDTSLHYVNGRWTNDEPIFISTVNSLRVRPQAKTEIPNLFLAADYVWVTWILV